MEEKLYSIKTTINGVSFSGTVATRKLLVDFIRDDLNLTGTHIGCGMGECGACTVLLDGQAINSCQVLAVQADKSDIITIEGLQGEDGSLHPVQKSFLENFAIQCGFCTPGMILTAVDLLRRYPTVSEQQIREHLSGNICRCSGYEAVVQAIYEASERKESQ